MDPIRVSAKAIILIEGRLLVIQKKDPWGNYYLLPGGGQQPGESLHETLRRECMEETNVEVEPGDLLFVRDYIGGNHEFAEWDRNMHQLELMFACQMRPGARPAMGNLPDEDQSGVLWLPVDDLENFRLYPRALINPLQQLLENHGPVYLGDVN
jgi:8-oxo-dGTP diphosphatase